MNFFIIWISFWLIVGAGAGCKPSLPGAKVRAAPGAKLPSAMLLDLEEHRSSERLAVAKGPVAIPEETTPMMGGESKPAMMLKDLEEPSAEMRRTSDRPIPIPEEPKPQ